MKMVKVIVIPSGKALTIPAYVEAWKQVKEMPNGTEVGGWDQFPVTREQVLADIRIGIFDRINKRTGVVLREPKQFRIVRALERRVSVECRWCGTAMTWRQKEYRFCSSDCQRDYYS